MIINIKLERERAMYSIYKSSRLGGILVFLMILMFTVACSSGSNEASKGSTETTEAVKLKEGASEKVASPPASEVPRSYTHEFGTTVIPASPKRIVGIYLDDFLLATGVKPLTQTMYGQRPLPYLQDMVGDLPKISPGKISLEMILEQDPDLILLADPFYAQEGRYKLFSEMAPTYVFTGSEPWREVLKRIAEMVGKPEAGQSWIKAYEEKTAAARAQLKKAIGDETVMFIRFSNAKNIKMEGGPDSYSGNILFRDLALKPSKMVKELAWGAESSVSISQEIIPEFDADHIFITYDKADSEEAETFRKSSLWNRVAAVQKGNLYEVDMFHWMNDGPISHSRKVDDVLAALLN
jgi:iron complex transport system substrate-binding protein